MRRAAILDLGTNTFHLLIIETRGSKDFVELLRKRIYVKLALDGIDHLSDAAMERGIRALQEFVLIINEYDIDEIKVVGTAALRTATNASYYIGQIKEKTGLIVQLIDGQKEAQLIYSGVSLIWNAPATPVLIMDIGGGSVEFIIADRHSFYWSDSYPVGVAVLYREFHTNEPISAQEIHTLDDFLTKQLCQLRKAIELYQPTLLIGASGTFDVVGTMIDGFADVTYREVANTTVVRLIEEIIMMDEKQRGKDERIPGSRVDMIVVALLLLKKVLSMGEFKQVGISAYALKEGVATTMI
ncbi:MAG: exopolyphosphatase [Saprospiraceae bacterium]|nr:exopolyphosphatase [Saprospiraceae bacterium]